MSQNNDIRKYLEAGKTITPLEAFKLFNCMCLAQRIANLKDDGMKIKPTRIHDKNTGKNYCRYELEK